MATNGVVASGMAQHTLARLEHIVGKFRRIPLGVWRTACLALLVIWLCYSLAQLFWLLIPAPAIEQPPVAPPGNTAFADQPANATADVDIDALTSLSLFGEGEAVVETAPARLPGIEQEAVETSLRLVLHGAIPSSDPQQAKAIIGDGGKQVGFRPGEELSVGPRGVKLAKVMVDRVILDNNGRYETLWLYDEQNSRASQVSSNTRRQVRRPVQVSASNQQADDARELLNAVAPDGDQQFPTDEQVRMVTDVLNVSMYREGGQLIGFRIRPKGDGELFEQLGLEPNAIVTAVNNIGLTDTSRAMEVYRSLGQESRATLEILRDGRTITVDVALDQ